LTPDIIIAEARVARSARALKIGTLRPAIVLYDEPHPLGDEIGTIQLADISRKPDMLIVMGTSLKVHGLKKLVKDFAKAVHACSPTSASNRKTSPLMGKVVFVNKTSPGSEWADVIDFHVKGDTDRWVEKVLGDWKKMRPADWQVQKKLDGDTSMDGFTVVKENANTKSKGILIFELSFGTLYLTSFQQETRKS
jgi:NAD-dependent histone deacetylase SIR2